MSIQFVLDLTRERCQSQEREKKRRKVRAPGEGEKFNATVVVDLAFDGMMSEKVRFGASTHFLIMLTN